MAEPRRLPWTDPATALIVALATLPITWLVGLEQVIVPALLIGFATAYIVIRRPVLHVEVWLLGLFLVVTVGSVTALSEAGDLSRWLRGLSVLLAGLAALVLASGIDVRGGDPLRLARAGVISVLALGLLGALVSVGWLPRSFGMPFPQLFELLPESARSGFVADRVLERALADAGGPLFEERSSLLFGLPRFNGFFLTHGGGLGTALLVLQTWILLGWSSYTPRWRTVACLALAFAVFALILTASRSALVLGILMLAIVGTWLLLADRLRRSVAIRIAAGGAALAIALTVAVPLPGGSLAERAFVEFRPGSLVSRLDSYERTFEGIGERPLLGWGGPERQTAAERVRAAIERRSQPAGERRSSAASRLPAGTHSEPLGVLYRFGFLGLAAYLAAWGALAVAVMRRLPASIRDRQPDHNGLLILAVGGGAVVIHALSHDVQADASSYWLCTALAGTARAFVVAGGLHRRTAGSPR